MAEKNLFYLHELSDYKVASDYPNVRGWEVREAGNKPVGKVDGLLVSKRDERVVYLDVELDQSILGKDYDPHAIPASEGVHGFTKDGERHLIVPIGLVDLDEEKEIVQSDQINYETFRSAKRYQKGSTIDRDYEMVLYKHYSSGSDTTDKQTSDDEFYNRNEFKRRNK